MIKLKRAYETPARSDGLRILVDRIWPRGLRKEDAAVDLWLKDLAPSSELRKWFGHDPQKWTEFKRRYFSELRGTGDLVRLLKYRCGEGTVTLVFGSKEERYNNAAALKEFLEKRAK